MNQHKEVSRQRTTPGKEHAMQTKPEYVSDAYKGSGKLAGKVALITGGDSGIGRAVAVLYAREGATVAISYLNEHADARKIQQLVQQEGAACELYPGDISDAAWCKELVKKAVGAFGQLDILVNNAAQQHVQKDLQDVTNEQWLQTMASNVNGMFYTTKAALKHLKKGSAVINTTSVVAFKGHPVLIDYTATKGAVLAFTRALAVNLGKKGIRVNAVAPGPIWTPLIPSTFSPEQVASFGKDTPLGRPGQPSEVAPAYVFLASSDASYITGQTIHVNGGSIVGG